MPKIPALPFIRSGISQGWSGRQAYREFQALAKEMTAETGERYVTMRMHDFQRLYTQTLVHRQDIVNAITRPVDRLPLGPEVNIRNTERATGYGTWVVLSQRTRGESDFIQTPYLIKSAQPITPQEAIDRVMQFAERDENNYNRVTLSVMYTGTERFIPKPTS